MTHWRIRILHSSHGDEIFPGVTNVSKDEESNTNKIEHKVCSMLMVDSYMKSKD